MAKPSRVNSKRVRKARHSEGELEKLLKFLTDNEVKDFFDWVSRLPDHFIKNYHPHSLNDIAKTFDWKNSTGYAPYNQLRYLAFFLQTEDDFKKFCRGLSISSPIHFKELFGSTTYLGVVNKLGKDGIKRIETELGWKKREFKLENLKDHDFNDPETYFAVFRFKRDLYKLPAWVVHKMRDHQPAVKQVVAILRKDPTRIQSKYKDKRFAPGVQRFLDEIEQEILSDKANLNQEEHFKRFSRELLEIVQKKSDKKIYALERDSKVYLSEPYLTLFSNLRLMMAGRKRIENSLYRILAHDLKTIVALSGFQKKEIASLPVLAEALRKKYLEYLYEGHNVLPFKSKKTKRPTKKSA